MPKTKVTEDQYRSMHRAGYTSAEAARRLGVARQTVSIAWKKMGLPPNKKPKRVFHPVVIRKDTIKKIDSISDLAGMQKGEVVELAIERLFDFVNLGGLDGKNKTISKRGP